MTLKCRVFIAALATASIIVPGAVATQAQTPSSGQTRTGAPVDPMANLKASLKARFGFTESQASTAIAKVQIIANSYRPKFIALQKKYGTSPTAEQRTKFQRETIPMIAEISKKTNAVFLSVATKEQRPKVMAQMKIEQQQIEKMQKGTKPSG
ncbi:MAG: hypothetical protein H8F28_15875 [Fibrella sp.]|nr:hypothetical protein [Armatimonadota bacterium]